MNILIVKLSAIGDVVHTLPSLAALRKRFPDAHISWAVEEAAADLICGHPHLDRVLVSGRKTWLRRMGDGQIAPPFREIGRFFRELRERPYDLVIDFHGLFKSAAVVFLSGGKRRLGYKSMQEMSGLFLNEKIPEDMTKHAVDRYLDFVAHLGGETAEKEFLIPIGEENRKRIDLLMKRAGIEAGNDFVAVSPEALWPTKLWDDGRFAELCDRIRSDLRLPVILTGADRGAVLPVRERMKETYVDLAGRTTLRDLAELYRRARVVVTTDSGPMHIAAAVGTKVVALFGPTDPARTGPYGEGHRVIRKSMECSPCFLRNCNHKTCMGGISVEEVFAAVQGALS